MGAFDDLVPAGGAPSGAFDDLVPKPKPAPRDVGMIESAYRGLMQRGASVSRMAGLAASAPFAISDIVSSAFAGRPVTAGMDWAGPRFVDPNERAVKSWEINPETEQQDVASKVAGGIGSMGIDLPLIIASGGSSVAPRLAPAVTGVADILRPALEHASRSMAVPAVTSGVETASRLGNAGVDPVTATAAAMNTGASTVGMGVIPLSAAGNVGRRVATGAASAPVFGQFERVVENQILGDQYQKQQRPFSWEDVVTQAVPGGILGAFLGPRAASSARPRTREALGYESGPPGGEPPGGGAQFAADFERYKPILEANGITDPDSVAAKMAVNALNAREARLAERRPGMEPATTTEGDLTPGILDQVQGGERSPRQTPWVGRSGEPLGRMISGERPGTAFEETPGNVAGREAVMMKPEDYALITERTGIPEAEVRALGEQSQFRLLKTAREAAAADAERAGAGEFRTSFTGGEEGQASPASTPNVPGERAPFNRSVAEDTAARLHPDQTETTPQSVAAAKAATAQKQAMLAELSTRRQQKDAMESSEAYRDLKRRAQLGMLDKDTQKIWTAIEGQRRKMADRIFALESQIYDIEARSELGTKSASGTSDRPFRGRDTGQPTEEQSRMFEERAREKAAAEQKRVLDDLEADWKAREELRQSRQQRAPREDRAEQRYRDSERSDNATKTGPQGAFTVDADGFVMSDKGAPIWFDHQRGAGWWILRKGNKESPTQVFEIANHPSGKGFTVRQTHVNEAPPRGNVPEGRAVVPSKGSSGEPPKGGSNAPEKPGPGPVDVRQQAGNGEAMGTRNAGSQEPAATRSEPRPGDAGGVERAAEAARYVVEEVNGREVVVERPSGDVMVETVPAGKDRAGFMREQADYLNGIDRAEKAKNRGEAVSSADRILDVSEPDFKRALSDPEVKAELKDAGISPESSAGYGFAKGWIAAERGLTAEQFDTAFANRINAAQRGAFTDGWTARLSRQGERNANEVSALRGNDANVGGQAPRPDVVRAGNEATRQGNAGVEAPRKDGEQPVREGGKFKSKALVQTERFNAWRVTDMPARARRRVQAKGPGEFVVEDRNSGKFIFAVSEAAAREAANAQSAGQAREILNAAREAMRKEQAAANPKPQRSWLLDDIKKRFGKLSWSLASDITGESNPIGKKGARSDIFAKPGPKNPHASEDLSDVARMLHDDGYDIESGDWTRAAEMIQDEMREPGKHLPFQDQESRFAAQAEAKSGAREHAEQLEIDNAVREYRESGKWPEGASEDVISAAENRMEREAIQFEDQPLADSDNLVTPEMLDKALTEAPNDFQIQPTGGAESAGGERASAENTPEGGRVQDIIPGGADQSAAASRVEEPGNARQYQGDAGKRPDVLPERQGGERRNEPGGDAADFGLESYTPEQLRQRAERVADAERQRVADERAAEAAERDRKRELQKQDDARRKAEELKARADAARDDFHLGQEEPSGRVNRDELAGQKDMLGEVADKSTEELKAQAKKSGGSDAGTLYANPFGKALEWAAGDAAAWGKSISGMIASIQRLKIKRHPDAGRVVKENWIRALLDSSSADIRAKVDKVGSDTARWVVDQFHQQAGSGRAVGETFETSMHSWINRHLVKLDPLLSDLSPEELRQVVNQVTSGSQSRAGTIIGDAAIAIKAALADSLKYMRDSGVDVGEVKRGYFPREFDREMVASRPRKEFVDALAYEYRRTGLGAKEAIEAAEALYNKEVFGEQAGIFSGGEGTGPAPFLKGRVFGKEVDNPSHPLNKFLVRNPLESLPKYLMSVAKRAEIAKRFGDNFSHWDNWKDDKGRLQQGIASKIEAEAGGGVMGPLRDYITMAAGLKGSGLSPRAQRASSWMRTWGALMFLEKATLSSLTEFIVPAIRSGNALDVGRSLSQTITDLVGVTRGAAERRAFAEDLGLISGHLSDSIMAERFFGGEPISRLESRVTHSFFRRTGLTQWTDATQIASANIAQVFMRRLAKDYADGGKLTKRQLADLGVPEAKQGEFVKFILSKNDGMPGSPDLAGPMGEQYAQAVRTFTRQSIMMPSATLKPAYMRSPIGAIVGQLQSFNYAFWENVLKRGGRMAKEGVTGEGYNLAERAQLLTPLIMIPMLWAAAYVVGEGRDALLGDPNRRKEETAGQKALKAISRGAPIAPIDPLLNYISAARYRTDAAKFFAGPVLGTMATGADAARDVFFNNTDTTNTQERKAAQAVYDIFIEPTINMTLGFAPVSPLTAAATQAAGSGTVREGFVSMVAGEKQEKGGRSTGRGAGRDVGRSVGRQ